MPLCFTGLTTFGKSSSEKVYSVTSPGKGALSKRGTDKWLRERQIMEKTRKLSLKRKAPSGSKGLKPTADKKNKVDEIPPANFGVPKAQNTSENPTLISSSEEENLSPHKGQDDRNCNGLDSKNIKQQNGFTVNTSAVDPSLRPLQQLILKSYKGVAEDSQETLCDLPPFIAKESCEVPGTKGCDTSEHSNCASAELPPLPLMCDRCRRRKPLEHRLSPTEHTQHRQTSAENRLNSTEQRQNSSIENRLNSTEQRQNSSIENRLNSTEQRQNSSIENRLNSTEHGPNSAECRLKQTEPDNDDRQHVGRSGSVGNKTDSGSLHGSLMTKQGRSDRSCSPVTAGDKVTSDRSRIQNSRAGEKPTVNGVGSKSFRQDRSIATLKHQTTGQVSGHLASNKELKMSASHSGLSDSVTREVGNSRQSSIEQVQSDFHIQPSTSNNIASNNHLIRDRNSNYYSLQSKNNIAEATGTENLRSSFSGNSKHCKAKRSDDETRTCHGEQSYPRDATLKNTETRTLAAESLKSGGKAEVEISESTTNRKGTSRDSSTGAQGTNHRLAEIKMKNCPLCQQEFEASVSQLDIDGHIAACLAASTDDVTW